MPYETFLDMFQKMCTIYEEEQEPMTGQAKCRELLQMSKGSSHLSSAILTLTYQLNIGQLTYTVATNHLQSVVSENNANTTTIREISSLTDVGGQGRGRGCGGRFHRSGGRGRERDDLRYYSQQEWESFS